MKIKVSNVNTPNWKEVTVKSFYMVRFWQQEKDMEQERRSLPDFLE